VRQVALANAHLRSGGWQLTLGDNLHGKTLGVLGLGNIGSEVARIGLAFGMEVIAWSRNLTADKAQACGARLVSKEELFQGADILTIHLVLSQRTKGLVGAEELQVMKPSARLINTSRGPIVNELALIEVLRERRIAGAALDVFDIEPLPADHPFRSLDNVLATPHIGFATRELYRAFYSDTVKNIMRWLDQQ
jgi:phosphoglycerate dehydrogenase-like enzyme